jgi:reverse gyrase
MSLTLTCPQCGGDKWSGTMEGGLHCSTCGPQHQMQFDEVLVRMVAKDEPQLVFRSSGVEVFVADTRQSPLVNGATLSVSNLKGSIPFKISRT